MKIAVYSGSFNPLHIGHAAIIRHLTEKMDFDRVYLVVSPKNPLKDNISQESGRERFEAAKKAVERGGFNAYVDDIELNMPSPQYTVKTLDALKVREPQNSFTFVLGADNLKQLHRWRDYGRILRDYGVVVFPRRGFDAVADRDALLDECSGYRIMIADAPEVDVSSTMIRDGITVGREMTDYLA